MRILTISILCIIYMQASGQLYYKLPENASKLFNEGNYAAALDLYREQYKKNPKNNNLKLKVAVCKLMTYQINEALDELKQLTTRANKPNDTEYWYALALHYNYDFKNAIKHYQIYLQNASDNKLKEQAQQNIKACKYALAISAKRQKVTFENIGKKVNTKFPELTPFVFPDEGMLYYTTKKEGTTGHVYDAKGYFASDIYMSKFKYGNWTRSRSVGRPNSYGNELVVSISENGNYLVYYVDNPLSKNNLQVAVRRKKYSFNPPKKIENKRINNNASKQPCGVFSNDGNVFIFASNRAGGYGGFDLYVAKKLPTGEWSEPKNLGPTINTEKDELYPYLFDNGQSLYFSSNGHNTIGGFDLQKSEYDNVKNVWKTPKNLGLPINTPFDDYTISFNKTKKYAYVSTWREDSYGEKDIYRITFDEADPMFTTIKTTVLTEDSVEYLPELTIEAYDKQDNLIGIYTKKQNKSNFIMVLQPGKYKINVLQNDQVIAQEIIFVKSHNQYRAFVNKKIILKRVSPPK